MSGQASLPLRVCVCLVGFCAIEGLGLHDRVDVRTNLGAFGSVLRFRCWLADSVLEKRV